MILMSKLTADMCHITLGAVKSQTFVEILQQDRMKKQQLKHTG